MSLILHIKTELICALLDEQMDGHTNKPILKVEEKKATSSLLTSWPVVVQCTSLQCKELLSELKSAPPKRLQRSLLPVKVTVWKRSRKMTGPVELRYVNCPGSYEKIISQRVFRY